MISDNIIKTQYIVNTGQRGFDKLKNEQISILESKRGTLSSKRFNVNELIEDVRARKMSISTSGSGVMFKMQVLKKLRFADMKKIANARVYNRPMWGIIFGEKDSVITRIQYDFTQDTRNAIYKQIKENIAAENISISI